MVPVAGQASSLIATYLDAAPSPFPEPTGGATQDRESVGTVIGGITINFQRLNTPTGFSTGDLLTFPLEQTCSTTPGGPLPCGIPFGWRWNVEVAAAVTDDASHWYTIQRVTDKETGQYTDAQDNMFPINLGVVPWQPDGPEQGFFQSKRDTNSVFYIDAPGPRYFVDYPQDTLAVVSANARFNFLSLVCNWAHFYHQYWNLNIVVNAGPTGPVLAQPPVSNAGLGLAPLN